MKRIASFLAVAVFCATPVLAQEKAAGPTLPPGWQARLDKEAADPTKVSFARMGGETELHATTGPAAIFWRAADEVKSGDFRVSAKFIQMKAPQHPEAYGIILAGSNLDKADQTYGYLIIRGDGKFAVKHRAGSEVHTLVDWTDSPAVKKQDEAGKATNELAVVTSGGVMKFLVNDVEVFQADAKVHSPYGIAGLRINHMLDVHISDFKVTPIK